VANELKFKITGLDELIKKMKEEMPEKARQGSIDGMKAGNKVVLGRMQDMAPESDDPHDSPGTLRKAMSSRVSTKAGANKDEVKGYVGPLGRVTYPRKLTGWLKNGRALHGFRRVITIARFLEFGTSTRPAKPFMRPAFLSSVDQAYEAIKDKIKKKLGL
jgi:HK97 gp10 family phage protein